MKENTRFCTRSLRDNTRFGGVIHFTELSPYPNSTTLSHGSPFAEKIIADRTFEEQCHRNIIQTDRRYLSKARQAADISDYKNVHIGCVAVYKGNIVGIGCNTNKTHPVQKYYNKYRNTDVDQETLLPKIHAEISCINSIRHLDIDFSKVKLYIYRKRNDKPYGMSRPCPSCMAAIKDLGIKHIYYTTNEGFAYECITQEDLV